MFEDSDLFLALAEIAGVFVGFGALIGVMRGARLGPLEVSRLRAVVMIGLIVMVASLLPVGLARYGLQAETLWRSSSILFLGLIWVAILTPLRDREHRETLLAEFRASPVVWGFFWIGLEIPIQVPLLLALLGRFPELFPAFYTTALVLNLFEAALLLVQLVFGRGEAEA